MKTNLIIIFLTLFTATNSLAVPHAHCDQSALLHFQWPESTQQHATQYVLMVKSLVESGRPWPLEFRDRNAYTSAYDNGIWLERFKAAVSLYSRGEASIEIVADEHIKARIPGPGRYLKLRRRGEADVNLLFLPTSIRTWSNE